MLNNTSNVVRYTITTPLASYSIPFPYWAKDEIVVYLTLSDGSISTLVEDTDYSVSTPNGNSGTLTRITGWTGSTKLTITREMPLKQLTDFRNGDVIDAETIEETFDQVVGQIQQQEEALSRAIKTPVDEAGSDITLPGRTARQGSGSGTILGFDSSGDVGVVRDLAQFDADVAQAHSDAADAAASKAAAASSESKAQKWAENPEDVPVETGKYSAKHHATKANASAGAAHASEVNAASSESNAASSAITAGNAKNDAVTAKDAAVQAKNDSISAKNISIQAKENSEAYALGTRGGVPVGSGDPTYQNNSKYYSEQAGNSANAAATSKAGADAAKDKAEKWANENKDVPVDSGKFSAKHFAEYSQDYANISKGHAEDAEAFATGKRNGVDVEPGDPAYHNNSLYYLNEIHLEPAVITDAEIDALFS